MLLSSLTLIKFIKCSMKENQNYIITIPQTSNICNPNLSDKNHIIVILGKSRIKPFIYLNI